LYDSFDQELSLLQAMYLRGIALKLIPAPGVIVEMLSVAPQDPDGTYKMNDLAWGAETWVGVRLHISPTAPGTLRDLLAVSITGTDLQGHALSLSGAMLQLPAVEQTAFLALLTDELVGRRLLEAEFGKASDELRQLARRGNRLDTMRKLAEMDEWFGHHPWLKAKMEQMRRLAEEDMMMMNRMMVIKVGMMMTMSMMMMSITMMIIMIVLSSTILMLVSATNRDANVKIQVKTRPQKSSPPH
jgi:hypothetical protein